MTVVRELGSLPVGATGRLRIGIEQFGGRTRLDLRLWVVNAEGQEVATKQGVGIHADQAEEFVALVVEGARVLLADKAA